MSNEANTNEAQRVDVPEELKSNLVWEVKKWLYRKLNRFSKDKCGRFLNNLANCYKEYDQITLNSERGGSVDFVDGSEIVGATFVEICGWVATFSSQRIATLQQELAQAKQSLAQAEKRAKEAADALKLCEPVLDAELTCLCESYCPPCEVGDTYDYSELQEPELGWITTTEAAFNAVIAALAPQPAPGAEKQP